jgi:hypothetical protein
LFFGLFEGKNCETILQSEVFKYQNDTIGNQANDENESKTIEKEAAAAIAKRAMINLMWVAVIGGRATIELEIEQMIRMRAKTMTQGPAAAMAKRTMINLMGGYVVGERAAAVKHVVCTDASKHEEDFPYRNQMLFLIECFQFL